MIDEMSSFMKVKDFGHVFLDVLTSLVFTCFVTVFKSSDSARSKARFYWYGRQRDFMPNFTNSGQVIARNNNDNNDNNNNNNHNRQCLHKLCEESLMMTSQVIFPTGWAMLVPFPSFPSFPGRRPSNAWVRCSRNSGVA